MDTFTTAANQGFTVLAKQFKASGIFKDNFWFAGNTFHTCLDYLIYTKTLDTNPNIGIVPTAYEIYKALLPTSDWWRDDYGWWGNAFLVALNNRSALGYAAPIYNPLFNTIAAAAEHCWSQMAGAWSNTPYGTKYDHAHGSAGNITGGTYNQLPTSDKGDMQGRNSVTNEGYWLLSFRLVRRNPTDPRFAQAVAAIQSWYQKWLAFPNNGTGLLNPQQLVLERPTGNGTAPTWYWSGDQGLFSLALFMSNANRPLALAIAQATQNHMTDGVGVLHENLGFVDAGLGQYLGDYATGKGIFMRCLADVNASVGNRFDGFIKANAAAIWCHRDAGNQFTFNWDRAPGYEPIHLNSKGVDLDRLIMQAAGQDALNTAVLVAPNGQITCS